MATSTQIMQHQAVNGALLEKVITANDLGGLSPVEKVQHIKNMCESIGLNPLTKPIQLIKFQGREIAYFTKEATEQLRKLNKVSITKLDPKMLDGGIYVVTATATMPDGRQDSSTAALVTRELKGEALANALMKCETKAKRRVTLSICGLGFIDESELDTMSTAKKVSTYQNTNTESELDDLALEFSSFILDIEKTQSLEELKSVFYRVNQKDWKSQQGLLSQIIDAKDKRKRDLESTIVTEFNQEIEQTGEVMS